MKKGKKIKVSTINKVTAVFSVFWCVAFCVLLGVFLYVTRKAEPLDMAAIISKSNMAVVEYEYGHVNILRNDRNSDGSQYASSYDLTVQRDDEFSTFVYRDSDDVSLYQCWSLGESGYDIWVYNAELDVWVRTSNDTSPAYSTMWEPMTAVGQYTLLEGTYPWYDTGEACYVLQLITSNDTWSKIYEEMYISASTYLPVGVVDVLSNTTEDVGHSYVTENVDLGDGETGDVSVETHKYDEVIQKYSLTYSHEDLRLFSIPETYLSEEEYMSLIEEDEENGEVQ